MSMRHADVAATLRTLVPARVDAEPKLDRRPPTQTGAWPAQARERTASDEMHALLLAAEADDDADELLGARRRSGRGVALVSILVILLSLGALAWFVTRPRTPAAPPAASEPASTDTR